MIVFQRHQQRHVGGHIARQAPRGGVEIALEEHVGHDGLQHHHRRHDDDQRTPEQSARQKALERKNRLERQIGSHTRSGTRT